MALNTSLEKINGLLSAYITMTTGEFKKIYGKGIPYQTLISGMIHQYIEGDLIEKKTR